MQKRILFWVSVFAVAFAFVEASVVVYLRAVYYPEGFTFPLKLMKPHHLAVEYAREAATILMLSSLGALVGRSRWQKFGYFLIAFGVWDIFYYVWLKVMLNWPASILDWDVLFLLPVPWLGPVIAPILISLLMITSAILIIQKDTTDPPFRTTTWSWILSIIGTTVIVYSFISDFQETLNLKLPKPYRYELLAVGILLYIGAMAAIFISKKRVNESS